MSIIQPDIKILKNSRLSDIPAEDWNRLNTDQHPLLSHSFLSALEQHIDLPCHGWYPQHYLVLREKQLIAALPMYLKQNSYGEFVFDWAWADALHQTGRPYYPKLVACFPFTPVVGKRFLIRDQDKPIASDLMRALFEDLEQLQISSAHFLFCDESDNDILNKQKLISRLNWHYHWFNHDYQHFEDFLSSLTSKRRKQIRKERRDIVQQGLSFEVLRDSEIQDHHWQSFYEFYCSTFERKWGEPRFTLEFFRALSESSDLHPILFFAKLHKQYVAGAFAILGNGILYGRHWGCNSYFPNLHFELCYYQTIEFCISNKIQRLDAGIQGEHKILRGFEPIRIYSKHWLKDEDFRTAVRRHVVEENRMIEMQIRQLKEHIPYREHS